MCLQSRYGHNGDGRLEVNDPVPPSLSGRGLPCSGLGTVPTLWFAQEAPKTVLTAPAVHSDFYWRSEAWVYKSKDWEEYGF